MAPNFVTFSWQRRGNETKDHNAKIAKLKTNKTWSKEKCKKRQRERKQRTGRGKMQYKDGRTNSRTNKTWSKEKCKKQQRERKQRAERGKCNTKKTASNQDVARKKAERKKKKAEIEKAKEVKAREKAGKEKKNEQHWWKEIIEFLQEWPLLRAAWAAANQVANVSNEPPSSDEHSETDFFEDLFVNSFFGTDIVSECSTMYLNNTGTPLNPTVITPESSKSHCDPSGSNVVNSTPLLLSASPHYQDSSSSHRQPCQPRQLLAQLNKSSNCQTLRITVGGKRPQSWTATQKQQVSAPRPAVGGKRLRSSIHLLSEDAGACEKCKEYWQVIEDKRLKLPHLKSRVIFLNDVTKLSSEIVSVQFLHDHFSTCERRGVRVHSLKKNLENCWNFPLTCLIVVNLSVIYRESSRMF